VWTAISEDSSKAWDLKKAWGRKKQGLAWTRKKRGLENGVDLNKAWT